MKAATKQDNWAPFLALFDEQNRQRPTRIGVFEGPPGAMADFWLENGLPLAGLDIDARDGTGLNIQIMLGDSRLGPNHMTHVVKGARSLKVLLSSSDNGDGLEIEGSDGMTTVLHFEERPRTDCADQLPQHETDQG